MPDRRVAPKVTHFSDITLHPEEIVTLPNGTELHLVDYGDLEVSRMSLQWDGGVLDYPDQAAATIMSMTLQEGTKNMAGSAIADTVDDCGARLGGSQSSHHTALELITINSRFEQLLPVIADIAAHADFPQNGLNAACKRMAANRAMQLERVAYAASNGLHSLLQGKGHRASFVAKPEDFENVTRDTVLSLYGTMRRSPLHVYVGGRLSDRIIEAISKTFGEMPGPTLRPIEVKPFSPETPRKEHVDMPGAVQSAVCMGMTAIDRGHPDYVALRLAVMALGGYFGSRLMANIREEKGLTYGISASLLGMREGAFIEISAQCDSRFVDRVIEETIKEIGKMQTCPPRGEELDRLRLHAWNNLATAADSAFGTLEHYITRLKVGAPKEYFRQQLDTIASLTPETLARVTAEYIRPESLSIVTSGAV